MDHFVAESFHDYLNAGNAWLFIPDATPLGALHGLEPGHSKTVMAAFIVSIRGTQLKQIALGFALVIAFSPGLAITLMTVGAIAAILLKQMPKHFKGLGNLVRTAPDCSAGIMVAAGMFVVVHGVRNLVR